MKSLLKKILHWVMLLLSDSKFASTRRFIGILSFFNLMLIFQYCLWLGRSTFFSSSGPTPVGCAKSYKIFDTDDTELFAGTLQGAISFSLQELDKDTPYYLVEYIDCGDCGTTESQDQCFKVTNTELARIIQKSCDCC